MVEGGLFLAFAGFTGIAFLVRATLTRTKGIFSGVGGGPDAELFPMIGVGR